MSVVKLLLLTNPKKFKTFK